MLLKIQQAQQIACSDIYREYGGYESDGGLYDTVQSRLRNNGWVYNPGTDAWHLKYPDRWELVSASWGPLKALCGPMGRVI